MNEIVFVTHNKGKVATAKEKLKGVNFVTYDYELSEPRSDDISLISKVKVMEANDVVKCPCISQDSGFFIDSLNGFQKAFVNFTKKILFLFKGKRFFFFKHLKSIGYDIHTNELYSNTLEKRIEMVFGSGITDYVRMTPEEKKKSRKKSTWNTVIFYVVYLVIMVLCWLYYSSLN